MAAVDGVLRGSRGRVLFILPVLLQLLRLRRHQPRRIRQERSAASRRASVAAGTRVIARIQQDQAQHVIRAIDVRHRQRECAGRARDHGLFRQSEVLFHIANIMFHTMFHGDARRAVGSAFRIDTPWEFAADAFDFVIVEPALEVMVAERHSPRHAAVGKRVDQLFDGGSHQFAGVFQCGRIAFPGRFGRCGCRSASQRRLREVSAYAESYPAIWLPLKITRSGRVASSEASMRLMVSLLTFGPSWMSANCNTRNLPDWWNCRRQAVRIRKAVDGPPLPLVGCAGAWLGGMLQFGHTSRVMQHWAITCAIHAGRQQIALPHRIRQIHQPTAQSDVNRQVRKTKNPRICEGSLAGMPGLEPRMAEPESAVLPITPHPNLAGVATSKSCPSYPRRFEPVLAP